MSSWRRLSALVSLEGLIQDTLESIRPAERITVSEAAVRYRRLNNPGSYQGPWSNDVAPYNVEVMDTLTSLKHTGIALVGPARSGKSDLFFNWLGHTAICDPADMMFVGMTQSVARDWSKGDLRKVFRHSPKIGERVMRGNAQLNTFDVFFKSGTRLLVKWPTITELSGKTVGRVWLADYDRMPLDVDKEGSPFKLAQKRTETFKRFGMTVAESSPGHAITDPKWRPSKANPHEAPPTNGILSLYNQGDRRRWYWKCVDCDEAFEPDFHLLEYKDLDDPMDAAMTTRMVCPHCGSVYSHGGSDDKPGKHKLNLSGKWLKEGERWLADGTVVGTPRRSETASFWLKGPAATFTTWEQLVYRYITALRGYEASGAEELLKTTVNVDLGLPYLPKSMEADRTPSELKERAKDLGERVVPSEVLFLVATVDVQKARFTVQVQGVSQTGDLYVIDRYDIRKSKRIDEDGDRFTVDPAGYLEDWDLLREQVLNASYPLADGSGRRMRVRAVGCDSGGKEGVTKNAYDFWRQLRDIGQHRRFHLVRGASKASTWRTKVTYPDSERTDRHAGARGEIPVLFINANLLKDQLAAMLNRTETGGMVLFPTWLPDWFYAELTAEKRGPKGWENPRKLRNESWDLLVYTLAVLLHKTINFELIDWDDPPEWALAHDDNALVFDPDESDSIDVDDEDEYDLSELGRKLI